MTSDRSFNDTSDRSFNDTSDRSFNDDTSDRTFNDIRQKKGRGSDDDQETHPSPNGLIHLIADAVQGIHDG